MNIFANDNEVLSIFKHTDIFFAKNSGLQINYDALRTTGVNKKNVLILTGKNSSAGLNELEKSQLDKILLAIGMEADDVSVVENAGVVPQIGRAHV